MENNEQMGLQTEEQNNSKVKKFFKCTAKAIGTATQIVKKKVDVAVQKRAEKKESARLDKNDSVFLDFYKSNKFHIPNVVKIVDDAERREKETREGVIGYLETIKGVEIFCLYDEAIEQSGLTFIPAPICDTVYYIHPYNRKKFIKVQDYLEHEQAEKFAELQHIAFALGAKLYWTEVITTQTQINTTEVNFNANDNLLGFLNTKQCKKSKKYTKATAQAVFRGKRKSFPPTLTWFANDDNVLNLIQMRCNEHKKMKYFGLLLDNNVTLSTQTALKIETAINIKIPKNLKIGFGVSSDNKIETKQKIQYILKF